jgi:hypothetical protein
MKAFFTYLGIFLFFGFASSQNQRLETSNLIKSTYSYSTIEAFQERSEKKVEDFYEYLGLLTQKNISEEAKNEIEESIYLLFDGKNPILINFLSENSEPIHLKELLSTLKNSEEIKFKVIQQSSTAVTGEYWLNFYTLQLQKNSGTKIFQLQQIIAFSPQQKKFGEQTKEVWELVLGEVNLF